MKVVQTAVLDSLLFTSLTKTHNCRLIVAKIQTHTKSALFQFIESQTLLPYTRQEITKNDLILNSTPENRL